MHQGPIYGNVTTNGGNVTHLTSIHGIIDNNVPLTIPPLVMPSLPTPQPNPVAFNSNTTITPASPGSASAPDELPRLQLVEECDVQSEWSRPNLCRRPCHQRFHRTGNRQHRALTSRSSSMAT